MAAEEAEGGPECQMARLDPCTGMEDKVRELYNVLNLQVPIRPTGIEVPIVPSDPNDFRHRLPPKYDEIVRRGPFPNLVPAGSAPQPVPVAPVAPVVQSQAREGAYGQPVPSSDLLLANSLSEDFVPSSASSQTTDTPPLATAGLTPAMPDGNYGPTAMPVGSYGSPASPLSFSSGSTNPETEGDFFGPALGQIQMASSYRTTQHALPPSDAPLMPNSQRNLAGERVIRNGLMDGLQRSFLKVQRLAALPTGQRFQTHKEYSDASDDFRSLAVKYGAIVINEISVPEEKRTLRPNRDAGGAAGGEKVKCFECLRIKNPNVLEDAIMALYGNQAYRAQKSPKHEFNNSSMFFAYVLRNKRKDITIVPPPCLLVTNLGVRVLVSLNMPLGKRVFGKSGTDPLSMPPNFDKAVCEKIDGVLKNSGLKKHRLNFDGYNDSCTLPFDAEVFECKNEETGEEFHVIVDPARLFPTTVTSPGDGVLDRFFRAEFVRRYFFETGKCLSNDAYNPRSKPEDNSDIKDAVKYYYEHILGRVVEHLREAPCEIFHDDLVRSVHFNGLNMRDLGMVYNMLDKPEDAAWRRRILVEVYARSLRRIVEDVLYQRVKDGKVTESDSKDDIMAIFWLVLGGVPEYKKSIELWVRKCFPGIKDIPTPECITGGEDYLVETFLRITSDLLGITWVPKIWENRRNKGFFKDHIKLFAASDIMDLHPRVLEVNLANHSRGYVAMERNPCTMEDLEASIHFFLLALDRQPTNEHTIVRYTRACERLARRYAQIGRTAEADVLMKKRRHWTMKACELPDPDPDTFFAGALLMMEDANALYANRTGTDDIRWREPLGKAHELLLMAWMKDRDHRHIGFMLADVTILLNKVDGEPVEEAIKRCIDDLLDYTTGKGKNGLYHRFLFSVIAGRREEARQAAEELRSAFEREDVQNAYQQMMKKQILEYLS